ncbi:MAG: MFS transporter [Clostridiales bacterium]|nr:MFS transporter [Clostridiales bacterium]
MDNETTSAKSASILWTIRYTLINATYFSAFCTIHACAAVFLLGNGFTNTEVGVLLALANIVSAIAQPVIAGIIDKQGTLTNRRFILFSVLVILAGSVILLFSENNKLLIFPIFALIYMIQFAYQPVMTALCFEYQKAGAPIVYGIARGLGSASFAVTSAFIGGLIEENGIKILLYINIAVMVLSAILIFTFKKPEKKIATSEKTDAEKDRDSEGSEKETPNSSFPAFIKAYPAFSLFLVGVICFFFAHNMINDFMIQIIRNLGGAEKELGYANFLQAILELPVMAMIGLILKKLSSKKLLLISGVAFLVKIMILIFATNMGHMYLSQSCQLFAYAVFIPAAAYYVSKTMADHDQVKGQAFVTSAITIGGVFSNLISGVILDNLGIRPMLITGTVVCAVGVVIGFYAMLKLPAREKK